MNGEQLFPWRAEGLLRTPLVDIAEELLFTVLIELDKSRLSGVIAQPKKHTRARIRDSVIGELLTSFEAANERSNAIIECAVNLLEDALDRLCEVPEKPHPQSILVKPHSDFGYADHFFDPSPHMLLEVLDRLDRNTARLLPCDQQPNHAIGVAALLLVMRSGLCCEQSVVSVFQALLDNARISVGAGVAWITVDMSLASGRQRRRVLLDSACFAACVAAKKAFASIEEDQPRSTRSVIRDSVKETMDWLWRSESDSPSCEPPSLSDVIFATSTLISLESCPLIASYSLGLVASTSLHEDTHCQLLGLESFRHSREDSRAFSADETGAEALLGFDLLAGDGEASGLAAELRECTPRSGPIDMDRLYGMLKVARDKAPENVAHPTGFWVIHWIIYLATERLSATRKKRSPSTVNTFRSSLCSRLLSILPESFDDVSDEALTEIIIEISETATSSAQRTRLLQRLGMFRRFLFKNGVVGDAVGQEGVGESGKYEVSARIISKPIYQNALQLLDSPRKLDIDSRLALEARCFLILTYRFGFRRSEALGMTVSDIAFGRMDCFIRIEPNRLRSLKTQNARRQLPMTLFSASERAEIGKLIDLRMSEAGEEVGGSAPLFFQSIPPNASTEFDSPSVDVAIEAVRLSAQDQRLHAHHLRHTFGTLQLLGELATTLSGTAFSRLPQWIKSGRSSAKTFHENVRSCIAPLKNRASAVSLAMGHGSTETTLQHYVHGLEWFPFTILRSIKECGWRVGSSSFPKRSNQAEDRLISFLLGLNTSTRFRNGKGEKARLKGVGLHARKHGLSVRELSTLSFGQRPIPTVVDAMTIPGAEDVAGWPKTVAARRFAEDFLHALSGVPELPLRNCLRAIDSYLPVGSESGWCSMPADAAFSFYETIKSYSNGVFRVEMRLIRYLGKTRKTELLKDSSISEWSKTRKGTVEVRINLPEGKGSSQRQRHFRTISWCLQAVIRWGDVPAI